MPYLLPEKKASILGSQFPLNKFKKKTLHFITNNMVKLIANMIRTGVLTSSEKKRNEEKGDYPHPQTHIPLQL